MHFSDLDKGWMMLSESNMMQLPVFPKALPFLIYMNICLTSHLPGTPCVLLSLVFKSIFLSLLQFTVYHSLQKNCHCTKAISYPRDYKAKLY